ncbi:hypothetical protein NLU13_3240 [Sarocladium strictum]|uniref:Uncharacterized protein n=1 Tax=Sarocladium strictum TaxID=5046 RepID=A0AA39GLM5_SARSR|nr:hypothetical protein NLU13_3240 [Sarocladium strictum]
MLRSAHIRLTATSSCWFGTSALPHKPPTVLLPYVPAVLPWLSIRSLSPLQLPSTMTSETTQDASTVAATEEPVRFRPGKKRKAYRQREDASSPVESTVSPVAPRDSNPSDDDDGEGRASATAALRLRNARKARAGGVGFSTAGSKPGSNGGDSTSNALVASRTAQDGESAVVQGITNRFTHQTGLVSTLNDKHMTEYIESRLSRRAEPSTSSPTNDHSSSQTHNPSLPSATVARAGAKHSTAVDPTVEQPTRQGRLMEVDLSEVPIRRPPQQVSGLAPAPKKQRLGPDGKPWRGRKRRASDDIKRDQLVEEFLHENRLDVYDTAQPENSVPGGDNQDGDGDGTTADDRLAEQFQRQYMDDMAARRRQRKKPAQTTAAAGPAEDVLKGPKLGGSRNARAAVRDALLKKEKEGRK